MTCVVGQAVEVGRIGAVIVAADLEFGVHEHEAVAVRDRAARGPSSANATWKPSLSRPWMASRSPVAKSQPGAAPWAVAYVWRTSGVS
jgi:hypothetical protein